VKHLPTWGGLGAAAGIATRCRKSPVGLVRWKLIVVAFGVTIPEMCVFGVVAVCLFVIRAGP